MALQIGIKRECRKYCGITNIKEGIIQKDESDGSHNMKSPIRNATDKKEGGWERKPDGIKGDEFSFIHRNPYIHIVISYIQVFWDLKYSKQSSR